jgi:hypothetical protein
VCAQLLEGFAEFRAGHEALLVDAARTRTDDVDSDDELGLTPACAGVAEQFAQQDVDSIKATIAAMMAAV